MTRYVKHKFMNNKFPNTNDACFKFLSSAGISSIFYSLTCFKPIAVIRDRKDVVVGAAVDDYQQCYIDW